MNCAEAEMPVAIRALMMGQDVVFMVTGGRAHIGASATAYITEDRTVHTDVLSISGHREGELAIELAMTAALTLGRTVAVLVGIHLDQPSKLDIEQIVAEARRKMRLVLDQWMDPNEIIDTGSFFNPNVKS
ncbi:MAG: hypothetical protein WDZ91_05465 [Paenibacillaceae bacterium]